MRRLLAMFPLLVVFSLNAYVAEGSSKLKTTPQVSKEQAVSIADQNGFSATWTRVMLKNGNWHISGFSKSANPPAYFVIDGITGAVTYKNLNTDVKKIPKEYDAIEPTERYNLNGLDWKP